MTDPTCPHCGTAIGEHEANACLDRLVSEAVFNVPFVKPKHGPCCTCQTCGHAFDECRCGYSTSIEKAWEVVERLCKDFEYYPISISKISGGGMWMVGVDDNEYNVDDHSLPLAICRAAVLAATGENT